MQPLGSPATVLSYLEGAEGVCLCVEGGGGAVSL